MRIFIFSVATLFGILCMLVRAEAQDTAPRRLFIDILGGPSLSSPKLAQQLFGDSKGDLGGNGWAGTARIGYYLAPRFGVFAQASYNDNLVRKEAIIKDVSEGYGITDATVTSLSNWQGNFLMGGVCMRLGGQKLGFEARLSAGRLGATSPVFTTAATLDGIGMTVDTKSKKTSAIAYGAGVSGHVGIGPTLAIILSADLVAAEATFEQVENTISLANGLQTTQAVDVSRIVGMANIGVGIRLRF